MLTPKQKEQLRVLISMNPSPEYMKKLSESDEFAVSEIEKRKLMATNMLEAQKSQLSKQLVVVQAKLDLLKEQA